MNPKLKIKEVYSVMIQGVNEIVVEEVGSAATVILD